MSLIALRRSSKTLALWLLLVVAWGLPHRADGGDACAPPGAETHDESKHVFSSGPSGEHGEHCAVCHWLRSLKPDLAYRTADYRQPDRASALASVTDARRSDTASRRVAARAPPFAN